MRGTAGIRGSFAHAQSDSLEHSAAPTMRHVPFVTMNTNAFVQALANAFVTGDQSDDAVLLRIRAVALGRRRDVLRLLRHYRSLAANGAVPRAREVEQLLRVTLRAADDDGVPLHVRPRRRAAVALFTPAMHANQMRAAPSMPWDTTTPPERPAMATVGALAEWLDVSVEDLLWFADCRDLNRRHASAALQHYHVSIRPKRNGGLRIIEAPQARLKVLQRKIHDEILTTIPLYYSAAHGFVKGRSVRSFAAEHVGQAIVLRMDLTDFFPTVSGARVQAVFRTMGYPEAVADLLGGLCTTATPRRAFDAAYARYDRLALLHATRTYSRPHLPQGAPTSPALANACAFRLDARLTGLADWAGATYSRYADDLAFSGGEAFARCVDRFTAEAAAIARDEGWRVQHHKTRLMRRGASQRLAGLVVNDRVNTPRAEYDQLKATLTNCVRFGPTTQNRDGVADFRAHLLGRVAWHASVHETRGRKLHALFDRITW